MTISNEVIVVALQAWRATPFGGDALMAALEAAAPIIAADAGAKALEDAADDFGNTYHGNWLRARAAAVRGEG